MHDTTDTVETTATATETPASPVEPAEVEAKAEATAVEEKLPDPKFASRFASLSRKEKAIRERETKLNDLERTYTAHDQAMAKAKDDPVAFLESVGWNLEKLANHVMSEGKPDPLSEVAKLREELKARDARAEEAQKQSATAREERMQSEFIAHTTRELQAQSDNYELLLAQHGADGGAQEVFSLIDQVYRHGAPNLGKQAGTILTIQDAAGIIESYLENEANKLFSTKKISSRYAQTPAPKTSASLAVKARPSAKVLSNSQASSSLLAEQARPQNDQEAFDEAVRILRQAGKK